MATLGSHYRCSYWYYLLKKVLLVSVVILYWLIGITVRVFANGLGDQGSISGRVIPKTQKMVLESSLLNTQYYKVWVKGEWSTQGKE